MQKDEFIVLLAFFLIVIIVFIFFRKKSPLKYRKIEKICTPAERRFYFLLKELLPHHYMLFTKVRIADLILPVSSKDRGRWQSAFNKIACKHLDFVVCDKEMRILFAIELDDASHQRKDRIERDRFVEWACKSAKLPLVRVKLQKEYDREALAKVIEGFCKKG